VSPFAKARHQINRQISPWINYFSFFNEDLVLFITSFDLDVCGGVVVALVVELNFLFLSPILVISWLACVTCSLCSCAFLNLINKLVPKKNQNIKNFVANRKKVFNLLGIF